MYTYKERTQSCSGCGDFDFIEHKLYHETGVSSSIIQNLGLTTVNEIENAFKNSTQITKCYISLNGKRTKIREKNKYSFPKDIINLIPNLTR